MSILNELAKLKAAPASGGALGHFTSANQTDPLVAQQLIPAASSNYLSSWTSSSSSYQRVFNHGGGQYSVVSRHTGSPGAQVFCQPFTVNQTTGAITLGSGSAIFSGSSNLDTGTFSQIGNYVMTQHTSGSSGNITTACTVSGNSVSGANTITQGSMQPMSNNDAAAYRSGSTMYMYPQVYSTSTSSMHRYTVSYNGSSLSNHSGPSNPSSGTSTHYTYPVVPQFGQTGPTTGAGLRQWMSNSNSIQFFDILDTNGTEAVNNINAQGLGIGVASSPFEGFGIELSNGRQLFYCDRNSIILRNGNTLTNVSGSADYIPKNMNNFISEIAPGGAADTWISISPNDYKELVRWRINPTTYKLTVLQSFPLFKYTKGNLYTLSNDHVSLTGSTNQFVVVGSPKGEAAGAFVQVLRSPFTA